MSDVNDLLNEPSDDGLGLPSDNDDELNLPNSDNEENENVSNQENPVVNNATTEENNNDDDELGIDGLNLDVDLENNNNNQENEEQQQNNEQQNETNETVNNSNEIVQEVPAKPLVQEGILISSIPPKYREEEEEGEKNEAEAPQETNNENVEEQEAFVNQTESSQKVEEVEGEAVQNEEEPQEASENEEEQQQKGEENSSEEQELDYLDDENIIYNYEDDEIVHIIFSPKKTQKTPDEKSIVTSSVQRDYSVQTSKRSKQDTKDFEERNRKSYTIKKAYRSLVDPVKNYKDPEHPYQEDEDLPDLKIEKNPTEQPKIKTFMQGKSKRLAESRNRRIIEGTIGPRSNLSYTQATIILNKFGISGKMAEDVLDNLGCSKDGNISSTKLRSYLLDLLSIENKSPESISIKYAVSNMKSTPLSPRKKQQANSK